MKKRVFIIHGWGGYPEEGWFPWLKGELEKKGFTVYIPFMPKSNKPEINSWVNKVDKITHKVNNSTYFIGHSIGCQTILRYLQTLSDKTKIGGVILIAGWFALTPESTETKEEKKIAKPWLDAPINFKKIRDIGKNIIAIFSDNDPDVDFKENSKIMIKELNAKVILLHNKGHFSGSDKVTKLPIVLKEMLKMAQ